MTEEQPRGKNGTPRRITRDLWIAMRDAYKQRPTLGFIQAQTGVGFKMARRAVSRGWPEYDLPPLAEAAEIEETESAAGEAHSQPLDEAKAADMTLRSAVEMAQAAQNYATELLRRAAPDPDSPIELSPKLLNQLTRSVCTASELVKRALEIKRMQDGTPRSSFWQSVGDLLDRCSDDELAEVAATGELPARLLDARPGATRLSDDNNEPNVAPDAAEDMLEE